MTVLVDYKVKRENKDHVVTKEIKENEEIQDHQVHQV